MDAKTMNYRWSFIGQRFIVSWKEHEYILDSLANGVKQVILREGKIGMNLTAPFVFKETNELTDEQEKAQIKALQLVAPPYQPPSPEDIERRRKMAEEFKKRMGWTANGVKNKPSAQLPAKIQEDGRFE